MAFQSTGNVGTNFGLNRTFNPKYTKYMSDGMGRDSYILRHNGGLCSEREPHFAESTRYASPTKFLSPPPPMKEATALKYISDGSGRDSYILINSGGNHVENQPFIKSTF